jgi:aspartyl-tRNA(Asn)/glutamyl-tRNA(Gln) amidotransferase subunit C
MSTLTTQDIQKITELSKLELSAEKEPAIKNSLENILTLVEKMNAVNTDSVEALAHPFDATQPLRADAVTEKDQRDVFQKNAPQVESGLYIVPKFVEAE